MTGISALATADSLIFLWHMDQLEALALQFSELFMSG